ncbi:hypothetical protein ACIRBY_37235 [Streptomyces sp. NPDC096136]|uniref:hypothetical protein n=1 Tax=Streptomyces sp. NPDC096136 TaxID=3366076 RepID=UPI0037F1F0DA
MQHDHAHDDWNERAIPTIPHQRAPQPTDDWNTARAARIPRQPHPDETDNT